MWGAAPRPDRFALLPFVFLAVLLPAGTQARRPVHVFVPPAPQRIWGVEVTSGDVSWLTGARGTEMRRAGVNALIVDRSRVGAVALTALRKGAALARIGLLVVDSKHPTQAVVAKRVSGPGGVFRLRVSGVFGQRLIALAPLGRGSFSRTAWKEAILAAAHGGANLTVSISPDATLAFRTVVLRLFLDLLRRTVSGGDTQAPTVPATLTVVGSTGVSISVSWSASTDNVGVTGYGRYRNGSLLSSGAVTRFTFTGLSCNTRYTLAVDAFDIAGIHSARRLLSASTSACSSASGQANVWVDTTGGSCARVATAGNYVDAQACGSLQAAMTAAESGDTVNIVDGSYGGQSLSAGTKTVVFRAAGPGRPRFGQVVSAASNVTFEGLQIEDRGDQSGPCSTAPFGVLVPCGTNETFDNVIIDGLNKGDKHGIESPGNKFTFMNGEVRNIVDQKGFEGGSDDMLIQNNYFHDIRLVTDGVHNECMYVDGGDRSVFRGNRFIGCPVMALAFTNWNGGPAYSKVVIENNVFGHTLDNTGHFHVGCTLHLGSGYNQQNRWNGWIVRYNTFDSCVLVDHMPGSGSQWYGNLGEDPDCNLVGWTFSYNVGKTCGGAGEIAVAAAVNDAGHPNQAPFYVNASASDFHLKTGSAAIDKGDPNRYPPTDKDGKERPSGTAPDAGAYEF